jgi:hypothetical protein
MAGFTGADMASARNTLFPPDDPSQIWRSDNPVGTETVQNLGMPQPTTYAGPVGQFIDPSTGQMTTQGQARMTDNPALGFDTGGVGMIKAYHGSPHQFDAFDMSKIGTGEGAQAYGHGMYLAENEGVARGYRDALTPKFVPNPERKALENEFSFADTVSRKAMTGPETEFNAAIAARNAVRERLANTPELIPNPSAPGHMYEVNVNADPERFLHWDKPLSEQSQFVRDALSKAGALDSLLAPSGTWAAGEAAGSVLKRAQNSGYHAADLFNRGGDPIELDAAGLSRRLHEAGIPGIRYLDQGSRGAGEGSHNYVVFSPEIMNIIRRYGLAGLMAGGGAAALSGQQGQE